MFWCLAEWIFQKTFLTPPIIITSVLLTVLSVLTAVV